jgi:hypothetical protein
MSSKKFLYCSGLIATFSLMSTSPLKAETGYSAELLQQSNYSLDQTRPLSDFIPALKVHVSADMHSDTPDQVQQPIATPAMVANAAATTTASLPSPKVNHWKAPRGAKTIMVPTAEFNRMRRIALRWETAYLTMSAIDAVQTIHGIKSKDARELNPIFGKNPSATKILLLKGAMGAAHYLTSRYTLAKKSEGCP